MYARFILSTGSSLDIYNPPTIEAKDGRPPGIGKKVNDQKI